MRRFVSAKVFVATPGGGTEDHAVLLACFFMYMEVPCWIVQGNAIPDGPAAYVVTSFKVPYLGLLFFTPEQ